MCESSSKADNKEVKQTGTEYIPLNQFREKEIDGFDEWWALLMDETNTDNEILEKRYDEFCEKRRIRGFTNMTKNKFTTDFILFVTKYKQKHNSQTNGKSTKSTGKTREQVVEEIERAREAAANGYFSLTPEY